ncbi:MAG: hypothetical protein AAF975_02050 [Spirochaetota bacterium]
MIWFSLAALVLGSGGGAVLAAKISKAHYERKAEKRLAEVKAEYARQMAKMQAIQQHKVETIKAVKSADDVQEVSDALDNLYRSFEFPH